MDFRILSGGRPGLRADYPAAFPQGPAEVRAYWEGLRRNGGIPARSDLDPRGLAQTLDRVFIAERIGPGLAQFRIGGSALGECAGADLRGLPVSCLFLTEARARLATVLERVLTTPIAADLRLEADRGIGRPALSARLLLLPLLDAAGQRTLVLGCFGFTGAIGRAPRRFGIDTVIEEQVLIAAKIAAKTPVQPAQAGCHLRLVHSA